MYYLVILVLLFLAELFYFKLADRCNIIDKPNERSSHTKVTLRGVPVLLTLIISWMASMELPAVILWLF